jgi:hypothetical protein
MACCRISSTASDQLTGDQRHVLEAGEETAAALAGHLAQVSRAGAVFAADADALDQARQNQNDRSKHADAVVARRDGDHQRARAHQGHREGEACLAALAVGIDAHDPGADGAHEEADRENGRRIQELGGLIALGKEDGCEIEREGGIDVPIVPLDHVASRSAEDRLETAFLVSDTVFHQHHATRFPTWAYAPNERAHGFRERMEGLSGGGSDWRLTAALSNWPPT